MIVALFGCYSDYVWTLTSCNNPLFVCYLTNSVMLPIYSFDGDLTWDYTLHLSDWCHVYLDINIQVPYTLNTILHYSAIFFFLMMLS